MRPRASGSEPGRRPQTLRGWGGHGTGSFLIARTSATFFFGGTSVLIVVGVALETVRQVEAQLTMRNYAAFLKEPHGHSAQPLAA